MTETVAKRDVQYVRDLCADMMTDALRIGEILKIDERSEEDFRWASTLESKYSFLQEEFENPEFVESMIQLMEQDFDLYDKIQSFLQNFQKI